MEKLIFEKGSMCKVRITDYEGKELFYCVVDGRDVEKGSRMLEEISSCRMEDAMSEEESEKVDSFLE